MHGENPYSTSANVDDRGAARGKGGKAFEFKEDIRVFSDDRQENLLYRIKANKISGFSA